MTNTVTARTAGPAIKRMLLKRFTTFPPLIRQYRRTRGHIPSITLHTSRRRSTHSRSFPSISHCLILLRFPYPCPYEFFYLAARLNREKVGHLDLRQTFQVTVHNIPADKWSTSPVNQSPETLKVGPIDVTDLYCTLHRWMATYLVTCPRNTAALNLSNTRLGPKSWNQHLYLHFALGNQKVTTCTMTSGLQNRKKIKGRVSETKNVQKVF